MLNTTTDTSDVMWREINDIILTLLGAFAQKEREEIRPRQWEGLDAAKSRGKHLGRPKLELTASQLILYELQRIMPTRYYRWALYVV